MSRDPLTPLEPLIRRVYSYVAYRLGNGPDAEDVTSEVFERALRYRETYDARRGEPSAWLIGIARRCVDDTLRERGPNAELDADGIEIEGPEQSAPARLDLEAAVASLGARDRELVALRYGADLTARQIAELLGEKTNAVEVALHRALRKLREALRDDPPPAPSQRAIGVPSTPIA